MAEDRSREVQRRVSGRVGGQRRRSSVSGDDDNDADSSVQRENPDSQRTADVMMQMTSDNEGMARLVQGEWVTSRI